jgi:inorganic pyrophosphatase
MTTELPKASSVPSLSFWNALDELVISHETVIDRPAGSPHPRDPNDMYPLDYGYLKGTSSNDGDGIDVWIGTHSSKLVNGIIVTVDLLKHDSEIKILLGCTKEDAQVIVARHNQGKQSALLIDRPINVTQADK